MSTSDRLEWFKCRQSLLLGAMSALPPDAQLVYITVLLRIYEVNGPCPDDARALSLRTHLPLRRVASALEVLTTGAKPKLHRCEGGLTNDFAEEELADRSGQKLARKKAAKKGASARWEKSEQNQSNGDANRMRLHAELELEVEDSPKKESPYPAGAGLFGSSVISIDPEPLPKGPPAARDDWPSEYVQQFWTRYPPQRRTDKAKVTKKLEQLRRARRVTWAVLMAGLDRYSKSSDVSRGFAKAPIVWLNGGCWEDEFQPREDPPHGEARRNSSAGGGFNALAAEIRARQQCARSENHRE